MIDTAQTTSVRTARRKAALASASALLAMSVLSPFAFFYLFPRLIVQSNPEQTVQNITAHPRAFVAGILCYLFTFVADVVVAWGLYVFLADVSRSLSLLAASFRLLYTAVASSALLSLICAYRLVSSGDYELLFGRALLRSQVQAMLSSFRYGWSFSLLFFAAHLLLLATLILRTPKIPTILGILLLLNAIGYVIDSLRPLLFPGLRLPFLAAAFFGELIFMVWLFLRGGRENAAAANVPA